jgi:hypothetical protein
LAVIPFERWDVDTVRAPSGSNAVRFGGFLHGVDRFDTAMFSTSPTEAVLMDPQQRLLLVHCLRVGPTFAVDMFKQAFRRSSVVSIASPSLISYLVLGVE